MLEMLEELFNSVSDTKLSWWPFLFLRPRKSQRMTNARIFFIALLYGLVGGLAANILFRLDSRPEIHPLVFPVAATLGLFVFYRLTFAYFWNARAARLARIRGFLGDRALD